MGLGTPPQLLKMVALGVDMFDCVLPSRVARNGLVFTLDGPMNLKNEKYRTDPTADCRERRGLGNYTCREFLPRLSPPPHGGGRDLGFDAAARCTTSVSTSI